MKQTIENSHSGRLIDRDLHEMIESVIMLPETASAWRNALAKDKKTPSKKSSFSAQPKWIAAAAAILLALSATALTRGIWPVGNQSPSAALPQDAAAEPETRYSAMGGETLFEQEDMYDAACEADFEMILSDMAELPAAPAPEFAEPQDNRYETIWAITGEMVLATDDFDDVLEHMGALTCAYGGYVDYTHISEQEPGNRYAEMTLRVPTEWLETFTAAVRETGHIAEETWDATDKTPYYRDSTERLRSQEEKMDRLGALMTSATRIQDILALEAAITDTQDTIGLSKADLLAVESGISHTTVHIRLMEDMTTQTEGASPLPLNERARQGLQASLNGIRSFLGEAAVFFAASSPFIAAAALIVLAVLLFNKRAHKKRGNG